MYKRQILYSLNPADFDMLGTILGAFEDDEIPGKIQLGSAWWFCDTNDGMYQQMRTLARLGILGNFIGMLTDSRSFLSYTRHEMCIRDRPYALPHEGQRIKQTGFAPCIPRDKACV